MDAGTKKTFLSVIFIISLSAAVFLPGMSALPLLDRDEPRFAEAGRFMLTTGDYLVPYFNNEVRYDKPPAVYWLMTAGYRIFGVNETGARAGSAAAGIVACVLIFLIARSMFNLHTAVIAGISAPLTVLILMECRIATADALLLLNIMIMFSGMWRIQTGRKSFLSFAMLYGGMAAGSLTKGPVPLAVMIAACLCHGILRSLRRGSGVRRLAESSLREFFAILNEYRAGIGIPAAAAIVMLWFAPAVIRTEGGFIRDGFYHHVIDRSFGPRAHEGHGGLPVLYYILLLPLTFFPWFAFLPSGVKSVRRRNPDAGRFLLAWAIAPLLVFSFLRTKLPHYVMPGYPALIIISASAISDLIRSKANLWKTTGGKIGLPAFGLAGIAAAGGIAAVPLLLGSPELIIHWLAPALAAAAWTLAAFACFVRGKNYFGFASMTLLMTSVIWLAAAVTIPSVNRNYYMYRDAAEDIIEADPANQVVAALHRPEPSLVFYLKREGRSVITAGRSSIDGLIEEHGNVIFLTRREDGDTVADHGGVKLQDLPPCLNTARMQWDKLSIWQITGR